MLNFTVGPVMECDEVRSVGGEQVPYFRTDEFSKIMLENETLIKKFAKSGDNSRAVFITGSGTASMEATVMNTLTRDDNVLVINGGSFGQRFVDLCNIHEIHYSEVQLEKGRTLTEEDLKSYKLETYTALLVNVHETSTGVHYDMDLIARICRQYNLFLVVDAISSFLADEFDMAKYGADVMIAGSQKALAVAPGISVIVMSEKAVNRVENNSDVKSLYFDLKGALKNGERGQTPFTPAVQILLQINKRLHMIDENGGVDTEVLRTKELATDFRNKIKHLPFEICSNSLSNAVTPLHPLNVSAYDVFLTLKDKYNIWVCPNGGAMKDEIFRVGHIGAFTTKDNDVLVAALNDMNAKGLL